jgi:Transposase DDE domain
MALMNYSTFPALKTKEVITNLKSNAELPFSQILPKEDINRNVQDAVIYRERMFTPHVTLWAFLSQVIDDDQSQQAAVSRVVAEFIARGEEPPSANTSAYSQARSKLSESLLSSLVRGIASQLVAEIPAEWLWTGRKIKLVDGSTVSMPDTQANQAAYPQEENQNPGVGFPIARVVVLVDYFTGAVADFAIGAYSGKETGEHALFRQLVSSVGAGEILLGDRYYPSFFLIATLLKNEIDGVFPIHSARHYDFKTGTSLGDKDHIAHWKRPAKPKWMEQHEYDSFPKEISVREVSIEKHRPGFRSQALILVTTLLDAVTTTKNMLAELYNYRWFVEISLRNIKTVMHMDILRGKTPGMVRKEIWVHLLAYNLIRKIMVQAAIIYQRRPAELSFKLALQTIKAFQQRGLLNDNNFEVYEKLLKAIAYKKVANRNGRQEPRAVKRRPKSFPRLQKARGFYKNAA